MGQPIGMKVHLLNAGAYEKKEGARDGKQKTPARLGRTMLCRLPHPHPRLYATSAAILSGAEPGIHTIERLRSELRAGLTLSVLLLRLCRCSRITLFMQNLAAF
jgi:hypothetical protein